MLTAPFPYYGGKRRWAKLVMPRLGDPADFDRMVYVEPFAGSLALLLANPTPFRREVVCDKNGMVVNFWRAMQAAPVDVARWGDYPTFHDDLTARHRWLIYWGLEHSGRLQEDADFYCAKAAGWWGWAMSNWIGGEFCNLPKYESQIPRQPYIGSKGDGHGRGINVNIEPCPQIPWLSATGGRGINAQLSGNKQPYVADRPGAQGMQVNRVMPSSRPCLPSSGSTPGVQYNALNSAGQTIGDGSRLLDWFYRLQQRLARVAVLNRDWQSALSPTLLMEGYSARKGVRVILDPPYRTDTGRKDTLYSDDAHATEVATASYNWAVGHGDEYGIVYFCLEGDFPVPAGWDSALGTLAGQSPKGAKTPEIAMFSPGLAPAAGGPQLALGLT